MVSHKAGFVVLLGRPNAGKSTLLNALLKTKLSIVSPKPQTTRHKILGILGGDGYQICLLDTPGMIPDPRDPLQGALRKTAQHAAHDEVDILILLVEPAPPDDATLKEWSAIARCGVPIILVLNKIDLPSAAGSHDAVLKAYQDAVQPAAVLRISAVRKQNLDALLKEILERLPDCPPFYDEGNLSDRFERFFVAEIIREQVFELYSQEIPHATAVVVETYKERPGGKDEIYATLYIERDGQKGIILGPGGRTLRDLVKRSQKAIEEFLSRRVELEVWVKLRKNWRKDERSLKEFGYIQGG